MKWKSFHSPRPEQAPAFPEIRNPDAMPSASPRGDLRQQVRQANRDSSRIGLSTVDGAHHFLRFL